MRIYLKRIIKLAIATITLAILFSLSTLWYFSHDLPDYKILTSYKPPISSRVHSGDGQLIAEYALQKRLFIPYESIPKKVINSFVSAEDKNFFSHPGVDAKSITRAIIKNLKNYFSEKRLEGASTITQQVAKNFLLTSEVSLKRKIKEAILAFRIERAYSKERIMELYLNQIYLGEGTYGIAAASLEYFDKAVNSLTYEEAALLAALPKAPSKYNPYKSIKKAKIRRNIVLKNLYENSYINKKEYENLKKKEIKTKKREIELLEEANFYSEEVRRIINKSYGYDNLYKGGLSIRTPLNLNYQIEALNALREGLEEYDRRHGWRGPIANLNKLNWQNDIKEFATDKSLNWNLAKVIEINKLTLKIETENKEIGFIDFKNINWTRKKSFEDLLKLNDIIYVKKIKKNKWSLKQLPNINGAIIVMDPYTGRVLSMVGGFSFKLSEFNRATQAKRQPGSAFKPFVYLTALENGFSPNSKILDAPFVIDQGSDLGKWSPSNYTNKFYGLSTMRLGLEKSRNLMTIRLAQMIGIESIVNKAKELNISNNLDPVLSMALGAGETTLEKLTIAYAMLVNGGKKISPSLIDRVQNRNGKTIEKHDERICLNCKSDQIDSSLEPKIVDSREQIIDSVNAYQVVSMLEGAVLRGTGKKVSVIKKPLAGKTGTTNDSNDAWFIGFSPNLVVGVYVGFDNPKTLGVRETGASVASPIFRDFMSLALETDIGVPFRVPSKAKLVKINLKTGELAKKNDKSVILEVFRSDSQIKNSRNDQNINKVKSDIKGLGGLY